MPTFVHTEKCDGCASSARVACMHVCPHDLMALDKARMKAFNREPEQCWECQACVKACPHGAVEVRSFQDWVPMGGAVVPERRDDAIEWTITFRDGEVKRFTFPVRTTPVGSIDPYGGKPPAGDIADQRLFTEAGVDLPVPDRRA